MSDLVPVASPSRITTTATHFTSLLDAQDTRATIQMSSEYKRIIDTLGDDLQGVQAAIQARRDAGLATPVSWLHKEQRYSSLLLQTKQQFDFYGSTLGQTLTRSQQTAIRLAEQNAHALIEASLPGAQSLLGSFNSLPDRSILQLTATFQKGSPLRELLDGFGDWASIQVQAELRDGLAKGLHPSQITKNILGKTGLAPTRAATISRTELYRSYREGTRATYAENRRLVQKWIWFAHLGGQTCAACLAMHGTEHDVDEPMGSHPNCRCTQLPKTPTWKELGFPDLPETRVTGDMLGPGEEWLWKQPIDVQKRAFGNVKLWRGWQEGDYVLKDTVRTLHSADWGTTRTIAGRDQAFAQATARREASYQLAIAEDRLQRLERQAAAKVPAWIQRTKKYYESPTEESIRKAGAEIRKKVDSAYAKSPLGKARLEIRDLEAQVAAKQKEYEALRLKLDKTSVMSPEFDILRIQKQKFLDEMSDLTIRKISVRNSITSGNLTGKEYRDVARETLRKIRPDFGKGTLSGNFAVDSQAVAIREIKEAVNWLPKEWVDGYNASGRIMRTKLVKRASFDDFEGRVGRGFVNVTVSGDGVYRTDVAIHELAHYAEFTRPLLRQAEKTFYERRTFGETLRHIPAHDAHEMYRPDAFTVPYMGKYYDGTFFELASMGTQTIFEQSGNYGHVFADEDFINFIYGILGGL